MKFPLVLEEVLSVIIMSKNCLEFGKYIHSFVNLRRMFDKKIFTSLIHMYHEFKNVEGAISVLNFIQSEGISIPVSSILEVLGVITDTKNSLEYGQQVHSLVHSLKMFDNLI